MWIKTISVALPVITSLVLINLPQTHLTQQQAAPIHNSTYTDITHIYSPDQSELLNLAPPSPEWGNEPRVLGSILTKGPDLSTEPVNPNGSIIIPKIGVNSPIIFNVAVNDKTAYQSALNQGVAHALGTATPSTNPSNTYLFAHSTDNESNIARYAAVFTKLKQLDPGDRITIFYQGKRYDYSVINEEIVPSFDTTVLTRKYPFPALTLQTCDPPGVPRDRWITTARLIGVYNR